MSKISLISEHISITPNICGGKPRIAGHRITIEDIVILHEKMGLSPDEIVFQYPTITLADVYAALTYYHDNLAEIRKQIQEDEEFAQQMSIITPSLVKQKLKQRILTGRASGITYVAQQKLIVQNPPSPM